MKKNLMATLVSVLLVHASSFYANAQLRCNNPWGTERITHTGIGISGSIFRGATDVGTFENRMLSFSDYRFGGGVYIYHNYKDVFAINLGVNTASISGADVNGSHFKRNLQYTTSITEFFLSGEAYFRQLFNPLDEPYRLQPYAGAGIASINFEPRTNYNGSMIKLRPLMTEGVAYSNAAIALMASIGVKYSIGNNVSLSAELCYRKTNTDYLDDVSTVFISPEWFDKNLSSANAALARALYDRSNPYDPAYSGPNSIRGNSLADDQYIGVSIKLAFGIF